MKLAKKAQAEKPTVSDSNLLKEGIDLLVEFIDDDSEFESLEAEFPPARRGIETQSRYFSREPKVEEARRPIELTDEMVDCDDFERLTTDECYQRLIRLRNDVPCSTVSL